MYFFPHALTHRSIHELMALNRALAGECRRYDERAEMLAIALDFEMAAFKSGGDITFNEFWGR